MKQINSIIGIDPGVKGGIALYRSGRATVYRMPEDLNRLKGLLQQEKELGETIVFIEKLSVRPDDVTSENGAANMGKLYRIQKMMANFEQLKAIISVCDVPYILVHPMKWQNKLGLRKNGEKEEKGERKNRYKEVAQELYPYIKTTLWNADALLIMHFGRYMLEHCPIWIKQNLPTSVQPNLFGND